MENCSFFFSHMSGTCPCFHFESEAQIPARFAFISVLAASCSKTQEPLMAHLGLPPPSEQGTSCPADKTDTFLWSWALWGPKGVGATTPSGQMVCDTRAHSFGESYLECKLPVRLILEKNAGYTVFECQNRHLLLLWPWARFITSPNPHVLIFKRKENSNICAMGLL